MGVIFFMLLQERGVLFDVGDDFGVRELLLELQETALDRLVLKHRVRLLWNGQDLLDGLLRFLPGSMTSLPQVAHFS